MINQCFITLAAFLCISLNFIFPFSAQAEIPFTQAKGMYQGTKDEMKRYSPFWGMVALHGKMLESIRFFGNYEKESESSTDIGKDSIAVLIKDLFSSPDGVQFVATTYKNTPVGNLSRNLHAINDIVEVLIVPSDSPASSPKAKPALENPEIKSLLTQKNEEESRVKKEIDLLKNEKAPNNQRKSEIQKEIGELNKKLKNFVANINQQIKALKSTENPPAESPRQETPVERITNILNKITPTMESMSEEERTKAVGANQSFANHLIAAFKAQEKLANPNNPKEQLYPENIVVTALMAFFVKVADNKSQLKELPLLMEDGFDEKSTFSKEAYLENKEKGYAYLNKIVADSENPELAFLMAKGFDAYENPFAQPINYRPDTCYKTPEGFPDCGETSWRNVVTLFLSAKKGGVVDAESIDTLKNNLQQFNPDVNFEDHKPFKKMLDFFGLFPDISEAATEKAHKAWADVVSDLNEGQPLQTLNDVQYGRFLKGGDVAQYEIKSAIHPEVRGIISMFNVIAKLIPDQVLNETWDPDRTIRLGQVTKKLDRLCELFSRKDMQLSWKNKDTQDKTINNEFMVVTFMESDDPVFGWRFVEGHFQLDPIAMAKNDWRSIYNKEEEMFKNEWMASLFLKLNEQKIIENEKYGSRFPRALIYSSVLRGVDNALQALCFVLYRNQENEGQLKQYFPLLTRWIQKSIPLTDEYSLERLTLLLLGSKDQKDIQNILNKSEFKAIPQKIKEIQSQSKSLLQLCVDKGLLMGTIMLSRIFPEDAKLNLKGNRTVTDAVLSKLSNLTHLDLENDSKITDDGIKDLRNLTHLSLARYNNITDKGIMGLSNLTSLNLGMNTKITDEAVEKLSNLINLDLEGNIKITNAALQKLHKLTNLNLSYNRKITNDGIRNLNLVSLNLKTNNTITDDGIKSLLNLTSLNLEDNRTITDDGIMGLSNLTILNLRESRKVTDDGIMRLINLTDLNLGNNENITNKGIMGLINLTDLNLGSNESITDEGLESLVKLTHLDLENNYNITDKGIKGLRNLTNLNLAINSKITDEGIKGLTNLTNLDLRANSRITDDGIKGLTNLRNLSLLATYRITDDGIKDLHNLTRLDLSKNDRITSKAVAELRARNPNIEIIGR